MDSELATKSNEFVVVKAIHKERCL